MAYLDDILIISSSEEESRTNTEMAKTHLELLGFKLSEKKCVLEPSQNLEFLGLTIDTLEMTLSTPKAKRQKIKREVEAILKKEHWPLRKLAATAGLLISVNRAMKIGMLMTRSLQLLIREEISRNSEWDNRNVRVSQEAREELRWWSANVSRMTGRPIIQPQNQEEIWTDASQSGGEQFGRTIQ